MPHGFQLPLPDHRLLRGPPSAHALRWCEAAVGHGATVVRAAALEGGTSSAVHAVDVRDGAGRARRLVLRRFVRADWLAEEPDAPLREAAALELLGPGPLPTPRLVAVDLRGTVADAPALLMTRLPGAIEWRPSDVDGFLRGLAAVLPEIHATPAPPPGAAIPAYDTYALEVREPPAWSRRPDLWRRAFASFEGPAPSGERCFIHRDYHPGNVLWRDGAITGVVDWACASVGSPLADVGYCRGNLAAELGIEAADRFLEHYRRVSGRADYDPYWDVVALLGGVDEFDREDERFLAHALGDSD
jgi:aminoglycoside phosphotransferase (APT) family kinase protein